MATFVFFLLHHLSSFSVQKGKVVGHHALLALLVHFVDGGWVHKLGAPHVFRVNALQNLQGRQLHMQVTFSFTGTLLC